MKKVIFLLCMLCTLFMSTTVEAATPRIMISDYEVSGNKVVSGENFDFKLTLKNESANPVKNIKVTVSTENGELLPRKGAGTAYVKEIKGGKEEEVSFEMAAAYGLEEKSYKLMIKIEYEGGGVSYSVDESVFIPVSLNQRLSVTDIYIADNDYEVGDTVEISAIVNNLGTGNLYNVSAKVTGDNLAESETYVGNIEPGKSGTVDFLSKASAVTEQTRNSNHLYISYEDKSGKQYENEISLDNINVKATVYDNFEVVKDTNDMQKTGKVMVWIVIAVCVAAVVIYGIRKRRKKKLAYLDEF